MPWLQLSLSAPKDQAPAVELALESLGALSVTYGDAADQPLLEPAPGETRLWNATRITGLFDADSDPDLLRAALQNALSARIFASLEQETLQDQVWERAWLDDFHPMRFGRRLWVCPAGQRPEQADAVVLDLDPGLAFGTGTHPSTALCLSWLDAHPPARARVLDFGCGSGILAIAAALLGADSITAADHDPQALEATADNAAKNHVAERIRILPVGQRPEGSFDLVLANILAGTLIELAPLLKRQVKPGGRILMAGILDEQAEQVSRVYEPQFEMCCPAREAEWVLLEGRRGES